MAAPLALYGPPEELLYVPRHVHGVVQVEVALRVQHRVTPATGHRVEPNHTQTSWQHIERNKRNKKKKKKTQQEQQDTLYSIEKAHAHWDGPGSYVSKDVLTHIGGNMP